MKNIHVLPTEVFNSMPYQIWKKKDGELWIPTKELPINSNLNGKVNVYITSNEEIKEGDAVIHDLAMFCELENPCDPDNLKSNTRKKIILTTDQDLIKDGVQAIDDEFLQWFAKNPSCEFVDVKLNSFGECHGNDCSCFDDGDQKVCIFYYPDYKIIIPQEEPKHISTKPFLDNADEDIVIHRPKQELPAYKLISNYYGQSKTKRSGIPLINHIDEGIEILKGIGADEDTIEAYCLHPLLQSDEEFNKNLNMDFSKVSTSALILAVEYRRVANSYLSTNKMEDFVGFTNEKIKQMLYADKIQNEKDFALYHEGKHERSKELREYFNNWLNILLK